MESLFSSLKERNRKRLMLALLTGAAVTASLSGCSLLPKEEPSLAPPLVKPSEDSVQTAEATRASLVKYMRGIGAFESTNVVYHALKQPGAVVEKMYVKSGDAVKKGDLLIQFQVGDLDLTVQEDELRVKYAEMNLREAVAAGNDEMADIRRIELNIAKTRLQKTKERLASKRMMAEADGIVVYAEHLERNQQVNDGRTLVSVADPTELRLVYEAINRNALTGVKPGMAAEIVHDKQTYAGVVTQTPDSAPDTLQPQLADKYTKTIYIAMEKVPANVDMGDIADIRVATQRSEETIVIPRGALRSYFGRTYVQVIEGESRKEFDVEIGVETPTEVEIIKGLNEGDVVILQ
jgi:multidrug efflux pump subunit AcrA (membrane-fusion protein)